MKTDKVANPRHRLEADGTDTHPLEAYGTLSQILEINGSRFMRDFSKDEIEKRRGAYLPHWTIENAVYHIRFSLADAIPVQIWNDLAKEKKMIIEKLSNGSGLSGLERRRIIRFYSERVESTLDSCHGSCWLADERIGAMVANTLRYFSGQRYFLYAWVVMPNHVHVVLQPQSGFKLTEILHSWKSFSANKANEILGRSGKFWLKEYFDRLIRDDSSLIECIDYVYNNLGTSCKNDNWQRFRIN